MIENKTIFLNRMGCSRLARVWTSYANQISKGYENFSDQGLKKPKREFSKEGLFIPSVAKNQWRNRKSIVCPFSNNCSRNTTSFHWRHCKDRDKSFDWSKSIPGPVTITTSYSNRLHHRMNKATHAFREKSSCRR